MYVFLPRMEMFLNGCNNIRKINLFKHFKTYIIKDCYGGYSSLSCKNNRENRFSFRRTCCTIRNGKKYFSQFQHKTRNSSSYTKNSYEFKHKTVLFYLTSAAVLTGGLSYAAVPLYRIYCQATGYGGTTKKQENFGDKILAMERVEDRELKIRFEAGTSRKLQWKFKPQQKEVKLTPGETALAFYTATNLTDRPIIGIATYNVIPFDAGQYFNKIQCFCFEEQQLNPHEEVDMPVFFYIDPEFDEDPKMARVEEIVLSYTFFESKEGMAPLPTPHISTPR